MRSVDAHGAAEIVTLPDFPHFCRDAVGAHTEVEDKTDVPLFTPAVLADPALGRSDDNVAAFGRFWIADVDMQHEEAVAVAWEALGARGWARLLYSSHNHGRKKPKDPPSAGTVRVRLLVELDRELTPGEWLLLWDRMNAIIGGIADPSCRKLSQPYYAPSCPPGSEPLWTFEGGGAVCVDALLAEAAPTEMTIPRLRRVSAGELTDLADLLRRHPRSSALREIGRSITAALKGEPMALAGARDETLWRACATIADKIPDADPMSVGELLEPGLRAMSDADQVFTAADAAAKLERHQAGRAERLAAEAAEAEKAKKTERERLITEATGGVRTTEATEAEAKTLADTYGADDPRHLKLFWSRGRFSYLLRVDGSIDPDPVMDCDLPSVARLRLAVFPWFDPQETTEAGGLRDKTIPELRKDYGGIFREVVYDLAADKSHFDAKTERLTIAPTPLRVQPKRSELAEAVIEAMDPTGRLRDWIAGAALQSRPTAALVLIGKRNVGKTLISRGLTRLRSVGAPTPFGSMTGHGAAHLVYSGGWVEADESMGDEYRRRGSVFLRSEVATRERIVNEKYRPLFTLRGCLRIVISANNMDVLSTAENASKADLDALGERLLHVQVPDSAGDVLRELVQKHGEERFNLLKDGDEMAAHALWLSQNHSYEKGSRFLTEGSAGSTLLANMASTMGARGEVTTWLLRYLESPSKIDSQRQLYLRVKDGVLWANPTGIANYWDAFSNTPPLSQAVITKALQGISLGRKQHWRPTGLSTLWYYGIGKEFLTAVLHTVGLTQEDFEQRLAIDTEARLAQQLGPKLVPPPEPEPGDDTPDVATPF